MMNAFAIVKKLLSENSYVPNKRRVLEELARQVERDVFRVDHAAHEPQPLGQHVLRALLDEHLAAVQRHGHVRLLA